MGHGVWRPDQDEYAPFYEGYVSLVADEVDILETLEGQHAEIQSLLREVGETRGDYRYAPGKWSIKEVVGHLADSERVFTYRALRFARNDATPLPGFEQDDYVRSGNFARRRMTELAAELAHARQSSLDLFRSLDEESLLRWGVANGSRIRVRAFPYLIAGHERHHIGVLRARYGVGERAATAAI